MKFFDVAFPDTNYRMKVLNLFPEEFKKGYHLYRKNKLQQDGSYPSNVSVPYGDKIDIDIYGNGWYMLDSEKTVKFSFPNGGNGAADLPLFINVIPSILDLDAAQQVNLQNIP